MRIPGFTAEASLDRTSQDYLMTLIPATTDKVVPQWCYSHPDGSSTCCYCYWGYCWCTIIHRVFLQ